MREIGVSQENMEVVASLMTSSRKNEAKQKLRILRCELMEELHACQRKVDQLDWLIRATENDD